MTDRILVVEDQLDIAELIKISLMELSLDVELVATGEQAMSLLEQKQYSLVMLDVMLPGMSGLDVCRKLRDDKPEQSILMLTSRNSETDRVVGIELGADDYMTKPFSVRELQARVRGLIRRVHLMNKLSQSQQQEAEPNRHISVGNLFIDNLSHKISVEGKELDLTSTEYDLLSYLASHPDQVFSRSQLLSSVWGYHHSGYEHTVNSHINRLRNKIEEDATRPEIVQTVWGVGYKFNPHGVCA